MQAASNIKLYTLPNVTGALVAKNADGSWSIFHAIAGGWAKRREWNPDPTLVKRIETAHNGHQHIYRANLSETPHQMRWLGFSDAELDDAFGPARALCAC